MASTNQSPEYSKAQGMYLNAKTDEERLRWLDEMIKQCPKHKSSEAMLANLKTRRKKLLTKIESGKKSGRGSGGRQNIKKEDQQAIIIGATGTGKSSLLALLTNTKPRVSPYPFTTKAPVVGMMFFAGIQIQLVEVPAIESEYFDRGIFHTADTIIFLVNKIEDIKKQEAFLEQAPGKKIIVFNNKDGLDERKIDATLRSRKLNYVMINTEAGSGLSDLKEKIFSSFDKIRVFTKEPGKQKSDKPIVLDQGATVKDVAEKIFHGFSKQVKESFVTGPSSKFPNQKVGLTHKLRDMDVVEFRTR